VAARSIPRDFAIGTAVVRGILVRSRQICAAEIARDCRAIARRAHHNGDFTGRFQPPV